MDRLFPFTTKHGTIAETLLAMVLNVLYIGIVGFWFGVGFSLARAVF